MPKRKRSTVAAPDTADSGSDDAAAICLPNNLPIGNGELLAIEANEQSRLAGIRDWYAKIAAVAPVPPPPSLVRKQAEREKRMMALIDLAAAVPQANRQYGTTAIEQWNGLTPPVEEVVCEAIALGLSRQKAAQLVGFKLAQLKLWLQLGAKNYAPYANFRARLLRAEVQSELIATAVVEEAAAVESRSAGIYLKLLERRYKQDVSEDEELEADIPTEQFTTEELRAFVDSKGEIVPARFLSIDAVAMTGEQDDGD